jgi:hypothetical protein
VRYYMGFSLCAFLFAFLVNVAWQTSAWAVSSLPDNCIAHSDRIHTTRLNNLLAEGVVSQTQDGQIHPTMTAEQLYSDPRFRNFPAISFELLRWCPTPEVIESSLVFLQKVGFDKKNIDSYFKKLLNLAENTNLVVRKDQVGAKLERIVFQNWLKEQNNENSKTLLASYAMAVFKDPADGKIKARAGSTMIGVYKNQAVFTLPYHALFVNDQKLACENFEFYFPKAPSAPAKATQTFLIVPTMDAVFCGLTLDERHLALKAAAMDSGPIAKHTTLLTVGVGTDPQTKKLSLTVDASDECRALVNEDQGLIYESGVLDTNTHRWAMGCDVSEGNSGDGIFRKTDGKLVALVTSRSPYTYQIYASDIFKNTLSLERLYLETSHFVPIHQIKEAMTQMPVNTISTEQRQWILWFQSL